MISHTGDSGAPVFRALNLQYDVGGTNQVTLVGVLWGRDGSGNTLVSSWFDVDYDFNAITFSPYP